MHPLEKRVEMLEQRVNRYRNLTLFLGLCLAALVFMGATDDDVQESGLIKARGIELVGDEGNVAVELASIDGHGYLTVYSREGKGLIHAGAEETSGDGVLEVYSKEGENLIYAGTDKSGHGLLNVNSKEGQELILAGADTSGDGAFTVLSKEGKMLIDAGADGAGNGLLRVNSKEGQKLIHAGAAVSGAWVELYNKAGEGIVQLYADDYGNGVVGAFDRKGKGSTLKPK